MSPAQLFFTDFDIKVDTPVKHGVNGIFILADIWITAMPVKVLHFYLPLLFAVGYGIFSLAHDLEGYTNALRQPYIYEVG